MSLWLEIALYGIGGAIAVAILAALIASRKPVRGLCSSVLQGACALAAVNVSGMLTGISLGINWFTAAVCGVLGVPGVITLLLLKLIFPL